LARIDNGEYASTQVWRKPSNQSQADDYVHGSNDPAMADQASGYSFIGAAESIKKSGLR
jgi:hypothetical protein